MPSSVAVTWLAAFYPWPQSKKLSTSRLIRVHVLCNGAALGLVFFGKQHLALYRTLVSCGTCASLLFSWNNHSDRGVQLAFAFMALTVVAPAFLLDNLTLSQAALWGSFFIFRVNAVTFVAWAGAPRWARICNIFFSSLIGPVVISMGTAKF